MDRVPAGCGQMWRPSGVTILGSFPDSVRPDDHRVFRRLSAPAEEKCTDCGRGAGAGALAAARRSDRGSTISPGKATCRCPAAFRRSRKLPSWRERTATWCGGWPISAIAVRAGQPLAEIEAPELDEQIRQAKAALQQAQAGVNQALSNLKRRPGRHGTRADHGPAVREPGGTRSGVQAG